MNHKPSKLSELCTEYLRIRVDLESTTAYHTRRAFDVLIEAVGDVDPMSFTRLHAEAFRCKLLGSYRPATAQSYIKTCRPLFRWFVRHWGGEDPFAGLPSVRVPRERPKVFDDQQVNLLLDSAEREVDYLRVLLAKTTGMRRGEILNLTWDDIDFERNIIYVQPKQETPETWKWQAKDKDYRVVPLVKPAADLMMRIRMGLPRSQPYVCLTEDRYAYLQFRRSRGQMTDRQRKCPDSNAKPLRRARKNAGVQGISLRHLRSTCLTKLAENNVPLHVIQSIAGHSSIETTRRYYIAVKPESIDAVRDIGATGLEPATS